MENISRKSIVETLGFFQDVILSEATSFVSRGYPAGRIRHNYRHLEAAQRALGALTDDEFDRLMQRAARRPPIRPNFNRFLRTLGAVLLLLLPCSGFTQVNLKSTPVPSDVVTVFINARCACSATDTATVTSFPAMYRSHFVNAIYDQGEVIPFEIYYAEKQGGQLYWISRGLCRNISTSVPLPQPGFYFVRFFHTAKPALIEIDARQPTLFIRAFGKCELHETRPPMLKKN